MIRSFQSWNGSCRVFDLDRTQPGILAGRLVEMSMNTNISGIVHTLVFSPLAAVRMHTRKKSTIRIKIKIMKMIKSAMKIKSRIKW